MLGRRSAVALQLFAIATLVACYFATQTHLVHPPPLRKPIGEALYANLAHYYAWALLAPVVIALAERYPIAAGRWQRALPTHAVAGGVLSVAQLALAEAAIGLAIPCQLGLADRMLLNIHSSLATYAVIVTVVHGIRWRRALRDRELRAATLEARLAEARLQALELQLSPHFLFNTLNSIGALMYDDPRAADEMLTRLGELLRETLDRRGVQEVALRDELDLLERYLEIEKIRFEDRLRIDLAVAPDALDVAVPSMSLQPLAENAIRYAIAPRPEGGRIAISARRGDDRLLIVIEDDGPGIDPAAPPREGVGLANTRARLRGLYGEHQRFSLGDRPGGGLRIEIELPCRSRERAA
jgi:two-component system LytT family sensor kinase